MKNIRGQGRPFFLVRLAGLSCLLVTLFSFSIPTTVLAEIRRPSPPLLEGRNFCLLPPDVDLNQVVRQAALLVPAPRQLAWQEMEFLAFVHFGMNTFTDREWGDGRENPSLFNPVEFDARQWVRVFKEAGMRMLILTAKHHDGFCLWPTKTTDHSVKQSPWRDGKGDVVREVATACREAGLKFGIYLSPWDRHEPTYGDSPAYNAFFRRQLQELLTDYGEITEVWFDGACGEGPNGRRQVYDWPSYYKLVRELQPGAVIFGMGPDIRWVGTETGYGRETEWSVVPVRLKDLDPSHFHSIEALSLDDLFLPGDMTDEDLGSREKLRQARALAWYPAETDVSIRPGWFYHQREDEAVKPPEKLVDIYFSSVGRNSVLLLNVPPDKRGRIHENDIKSLQGMRQILDRIFSINHVAGATVAATSEDPEHPARLLVDGNPKTSWRPEGDRRPVRVEIRLPQKRTFNVVELQEDIRFGQRVEAFYLEVWDGRAWRTFARGTTIGYKRLLTFSDITADRIRLTISRSRLAFHLATLSLYSHRGRTMPSS